MFYKSTEIKLTEDFMVRAFAIDRGIVIEDSATQNG
jgi:predicted PhzF superfamily epimerase YddE/YHI9